MSDPTILLVDDEEPIRLSCGQAFEIEDMPCLAFPSTSGVMDHISRSFPGVVVTDVRMPNEDGMALLSRIQAIDPDIPVILVTGHGDVALAVEAMRAGAYDFIEKPFETDRLIDVVRRGLEKRSLILQNRNLTQQLEQSDGLSSVLIGRSDPMRALRQDIRSVADTAADILVLGETGAGKEIVSRCLHNHSPRAKGRFVAINCGAIPDNIIESELFGHEAGAFTGAQKRRIGKFEYATGGTIFLDEIESMPMDLQVKMLRVLEERALERLGGNEMIPLDVRVIAATKVDLLEASGRGDFREDLYYRLNVVSINIPALRDRKQDIPLLFTLFAGQAAKRHGRDNPMPDQNLLLGLMSHDWPGNVRELKNSAERFVLGLPPLSGNILQVRKDVQGSPLVNQVEAFERHLIEQALAEARGSAKQAYESLGLPRKTFYDKLKKYGLDRKDFLRE
ncbi:sigma-54-dependent transcriptional regulator [Aestuariispira insulae]|uniref:Two-component system C4-dicarboxylate transport response regulator DctD n=1 Tax=Aestuariispira insulae TaxID=1461337 RepID=A0A3D9HMX1_9PROT|nr:sigma-54 dependent transcriptional regulator [Aestuariispira insulae]RED50843.1 two-component system C4-dicarboxylate transport response regulator DctD [Aestuariispira insulae]